MHNHHQDTSGNADLRNIKIALVLNLAFVGIEIIGGIWTNSVAIFADAIHDLGDSIALGIAWYFQKLSKRGSTQKFSYGFKRFSILGALINSSILLIGSCFILIESIPRLLAPEESHSIGIMLLAVVGVIMNGGVFTLLRKGSSVNEKILSLHILEDVLGWLAILIGGLIMWLTNWSIIDPILSILITGYILFNVVRNLKKVMHIIMQGAPPIEETKKIEAFFNHLDGIKSYHDLHIWSLDGSYYVLTVHLVVSEETTPNELIALKEKVKAQLKTLNIEHPTLELEFESEDCSLQENKRVTKHPDQSHKKK